MYDKYLVLAVLSQIDEALGKIVHRTVNIKSANDFSDSPEGMEKLDGICMLFMAIGESLKNVDKITGKNIGSPLIASAFRYAMLSVRGESCLLFSEEGC